MPQKSLASSFVNERGERTALRISPGVQLDRKMAVINDALKRWRVPQILLRQIQRYTVSATRETSPLVKSREKVASRSGTSSRLVSLGSVLALFLEGPDLTDALRSPLIHLFWA
jgi:hypothetical protein